MKDLALAVGSSSFSVLLTIVTINRIDDRKEAEHTKYQTEIAFNQLLTALNRHIVLIQLIYKSSGANIQSPFPQNFHELFESRFDEVLSDLDLSQQAEIIPKPQTIWAKHLQFSIDELRQELGDTLARFGHSLDIKDSLLIADLRNTSLFDYLRQLPVVINFLLAENITQNFGVNKLINRQEDISVYKERLHSLIERINSFLGSESGVKLKLDIWDPASRPILFTD